MRILVVEDERTLRDGLGDLLTGDGHVVELAADGARGLELGLAEPFDVVVLDLMLPKLDGVDVCRRLREARPALSILMLTARGSEDNKVRGLLEGADDYMTKPFSARELLARVRTLGRRHLAQSDVERLSIDDAVLDLSNLVCRRGDARLSLTSREAGIIRFLYRYRIRAVSRAELLENVWGASAEMETRAVDVAIATLRKKVESDPRRPRVIVTVKGVGYRFGEVAG